MFEGGDSGEELGVVPVLDDGGDEEFGDLYAGVTDCELWIEEKLRRVNPRLRMRIRVEQARAKRELPPNGGSWDGSAVDVMKDPEVFESLPDPVSQFEYWDVGGDVEICVFTPDVDYFELGVCRDTVFNPSEVSFPLGSLVQIPISPRLANHQVVKETQKELLLEIRNTDAWRKPVQTPFQDSDEFGLIQMMPFVVLQRLQSQSFFLELLSGTVKEVDEREHVSTCKKAKRAGVPSHVT